MEPFSGGEAAMMGVVARGGEVQATSGELLTKNSPEAPRHNSLTVWCSCGQLSNDVGLLSHWRALIKPPASTSTSTT